MKQSKYCDFSGIGEFDKTTRFYTPWASNRAELWKKPGQQARPRPTHPF